MEKKYIVQVFDRSTNEWYNLSQMDWDKAIEEAYSQVKTLVNVWNYNKNNKPIVLKPNDVTEFNKAMNNGQNWCVANHVVGITDVTPNEPEVEYENKIILIDGCELDYNDIKAMQIPFESGKFFREYMKRVVGVFGGTYKLIDPNKFDTLFDEIKKQNLQVVHTKINFK